MTNLWDRDMSSYDELWNSIKTLVSLGLIDHKYDDVMVHHDDELFMKSHDEKHSAKIFYA